MTQRDPDLMPATVAVRQWGKHGLWLAVVMDGSTVVARLLALSEDAAFEKASLWAAPRPSSRAHWSAIPEPREPDEWSPHD